MPENRAENESPTGGDDRRKNLELRERLDEIVALARVLTQQGPDMSREELDEARLRIEWLAEEIWGAAVYGPIAIRERSTESA